MSTCAQDDATLVARYAKTRDEEAFRVLVERYSSLVFGQCFRRLQRSDLAEDATQMVFVELARSASKLAGRRSVGPWLYTCASNISVGLLRQEKRRSARERGAASRPGGHEPTFTDSALDEAMALLSTSERDALVLRFVEEFSLADVGRTLGVSEDAARMRVNRALESLRKTLAKLGIDGSEALIVSSLGAVRLPPPPTLTIRVERTLPPKPAGGVVQMLNPLPVVSTIVAVGVIVVGGGSTAYLVLGRQPQQPPVTAQPTPTSVRSPLSTTERETALAAWVKEFPGIWKVRMVQVVQGHRKEVQRFPHVTVRYDVRQKALLIHGENPNPEDPPMDGKWVVDPDHATLGVSSKANPQPPFTLVSVSTAGKSKELAFEAEIEQARVQAKITYNHRQLTLDYSQSDSTEKGGPPNHALVIFDR